MHSIINIFKNILFQLYLEKILTDDVRLQDKYSAFVNTLQHQENYDLVLDFMINNYEKMLEA